MPRLADPALPERRRAQILDAARYCFRERGFRQTTIEEICGEARVSPGALYRYFSAKADIIAAIALEARAQAEAALDRLDDSDGLVDALADMARAYFEALGDPREASLLTDIWAEAARDPALAKALASRHAAALDRVTAAIRRAQRAGFVYPALDAGDAAEMLTATLEGMALRGPGPDAARRYRTLALHLLKPKR